MRKNGDGSIADKRRYSLTAAAAADVGNIAAYTLSKFGHAQAARYEQGLIQRLQAIADHPLRYPQIDHVAEGYRRSVYRSHAIYYRQIENGAVLIVRILNK